MSSKRLLAVLTLALGLILAVLLSIPETAATAPPTPQEQLDA